MRNIPNKVDDSGDTLPAGDFNAWKNEAQGVVISAGLSLDPENGPDTDTEMVKKALAIITSMGCYYDDSGSANAYVLTHPNSTEHVPAYEDGMIILFKPANTNTGASTVNINSLGVKNITLEDGTALSSGVIVSGNHVLCQYNLTADRIELIRLDADTVDRIHASTTATANQLLALNGSSKLPADITGDADTVDGDHASAFVKPNTSVTLTTLAITGAGGVTANTLYKDNIVNGWVNYDQVAVTIEDSFNVSSVSDDGVGQFTVNWNTDFANINYVALATSDQDNISLNSKVVGSCGFKSFDTNNVSIDSGNNCCLGIGDQ
jgi:hypothetical protein